jgi:hypothetical protein
MNSEQRILDNRPSPDRFTPPISLLYDGFGVFEDVRQGVRVPGEDNILEAQLWDRVGEYMERMVKFYDSEEDRQDFVIQCLQEIFRARKDPDAIGELISSSDVGSRQITSGGYLNGAHEAMVFCFNCKNELSTIACEPSAELVSYVATSFKELLNGKHQALFRRWRIPALGMTQIGERLPCPSRLYFLTDFCTRSLRSIFRDCRAGATDTCRPLDTDDAARDPNRRRTVSKEHFPSV